MLSRSLCCLSWAGGTIRSRRTWSLPDIRKQNTATTDVHELQRIARAAQVELPAAAQAARHGRRSYQADAQSALLSRPGGRQSRLQDPAATFHYKRRRPKMKFNAGAFRRHYGSS